MVLAAVIIVSVGFNLALPFHGLSRSELGTRFLQRAR